MLLLPGAIAVLIGRTTWGLTWADTWSFAVIAIVTMFVVGLLGAAAQAHLLGSNLRGGRSAGEEFMENDPFVFYAPWVIVSVLAGALALEINYLN